MINFYSKIDIPESCYLGKRLFKKLFYENTTLNATDKKAFANDIEDIEWKYTLKPETINIQKYEDDEHEYLEVAIIRVNLKESARYKRISEIIQRAIPYPLIIVFKYETSVALCLAMKRINRADQDKIMVEKFHYTDWIDLNNPFPHQTTFLDSICIKNFSFDNFYQWYSDFVNRIVAVNCGDISGNYVVDPEKPDVNRVEELEMIYSLEQQQNKLRSDLKKESQFNKRVDLNMKIKKITEQINNHKSKIQDSGAEDEQT